MVKAALVTSAIDSEPDEEIPSKRRRRPIDHFTESSDESCGIQKSPKGKTSVRRNILPKNTPVNQHDSLSLGSRGMTVSNQRGSSLASLANTPDSQHQNSSAGFKFGSLIS
jgi:hypothetical protein